MIVQPKGIARADCVRSRGIFFPKDKQIIRGRLRGALREHRYEAKESDAVVGLLQPGDVVLELGGGIGYMSTLAATKCDIAHVHTFEANPHLIPYIERVHAANGVTNATVHNALLGARKGSAEFHVRFNLLASSLVEPVEGTVLSVEKIEVRNARQTSTEIAPTVLICDIEGAEADVIPRLNLSTVRAACVELHPQWIGPEGVAAVFGAFAKAGLTYYHGGSHGKVVCFSRDWSVKPV
ncbi:MAG: FkbM family methyltransferase [Pseudomonadota bacterium]